MLLNVLVYVLMYLKLMKQAEIRKRSSLHDSHAQLTRISGKVTMVLITFSICYLPHGIQNSISVCLDYHEIAIDDE